MNAYYSDGGVVWLVAYGERFMLHGTYSKDAGEHIVQRILTSVDSDRAIAYAEGRKDEQDELSSVLPGVWYMDPPDGGAPTILEQLQRQAKDAARYCWLRNRAHVKGLNVITFTYALGIPQGASENGFKSIPPHELDAAIDAALPACDHKRNQTQDNVK